MKKLKTYPNLYDSQLSIFNKLNVIINRDNSALDFSETGLGKTIVGATLAINNGSKILVVSPVSLQNSWKKALDGFDATICTKAKIPTERDFDFIIIDENHQFQN